MGKKKKGGKKKGGKKKGGKKKKGGGSGSKHVNIGRPPMKAEPDDYVKILVKLCHWNFMDFEMVLPTHTKLFIIKRKLIEKFGKMDNFKMYRSDKSMSMLEKNLLVDELSTLAENDFKGKPFDPTKTTSEEVENKVDDVPEENNEDDANVEEMNEDDVDLPEYVIMFDYTPNSNDAPLLLAETIL